MKKIDSFQELKDELKPGDEFYIVNQGNLTHWKFACVHPQNYDAIVCISSGDVETAKVISKYSFKWEACVFTGKYDSKLLGECMLIQMKDRIDSINKIYIKNETNP